MAENFLGEIRMIGFKFAPRGWADCYGQTMPIAQTGALYALLGITFGGNGTNNFNLPNMQGRVPVHPGNNTAQGQIGGAEEITLTEPHLPAHSHTFYANDAAANQYGIGGRGDRFLAQPKGDDEDPAPPPIYGNGDSGNLVALDPAGLEPDTGGGQPHSNLQPSLVIRYAIALEGLFPSRS